MTVQDERRTQLDAEINVAGILCWVAGFGVLLLCVAVYAALAYWFSFRLPDNADMFSYTVLAACVVLAAAAGTAVMFLLMLVVYFSCLFDRKEQMLQQVVVVPCDVLHDFISIADAQILRFGDKHAVKAYEAHRAAVLDYAPRDFVLPPMRERV